MSSFSFQGHHLSRRSCISFNNNVDLEAANKIPSFMRVPYMELIASPEEEETKTVRSLEVLSNMPQGETFVTFQRK